MSFMEYPETMMLGNKLMDQEHEVLISCINLLQESVKEEHDNQEISEILGGLVDYAKTHFFVEEELMRAYDYPGATAHKIEHDSFKKKIDMLARHFEQGNVLIEDRLLDFLKGWLIEHILKTDASLANFLKEKGMP